MIPDPSMPVAPAEIQAQASITGVGLQGIARYEWLVLDETGNTVSVELRSPTTTEISLVAIRAENPGPYRVRVSGSAGEIACTPATTVINVGAQGAEVGYFRLRVVPRPSSQNVPAQERDVTIRGGANYEMGPVALDPGVIAEGEVTSASGQPLAAYVRATPSDRAEATALEAFADDTGVFRMLVENGLYDVLVVPQDRTLAPALFRGVQARMMQLAMPEAVLVGGVVRDALGEPLGGARIAVQAPDMPASVVEADALGRFSLEAAAGARLSLTVVPPPERGVLSLVAEDLEAGAIAKDLSIVYTSEPADRAVAAQVLTETGAPAPFARVTWVSRDISGAGQVLGAGGAVLAATGRSRVTQVADAAGRLPAVTLPEAVYDVVIEAEPGAAGGSVTRTAVDLAAPPSTLALAAPAQVRGRVVLRGDGSEPIAGARLTARPLDLLSHTSSVVATADESGAFVLRLAGGARYELVIEGAGTEGYGSQAIRERWMIDVPASGDEADLGTIALLRALRLTGRITVNNVGAGGVTLRLLCSACTEEQDPSWAIAEAVSDPSGAFVLRVPDLGIAQAASLVRSAGTWLSGGASRASDK